MKQRTLTAFVMALVLIPILIIGNTYQIFNLLILVLIGLASYELTTVFQKGKSLPTWLTGFYIAASLVTGTVFYYALTEVLPWNIFFISFLSIFFIQMFFLVFVKNYDSIEFGKGFVVIYYASLGFASISFLRDLGITTVLYVILIAIFTDTFAYLFGVKYGKHKIAPLISPKKSVEGSIAGFIFGGGIGTIFALFFPVLDLHFVWILIISFFISILGQIGDLVASKFKRDSDVKDYSALLPGHGGILDRFDSMIFVSLSFTLLYLVMSAAL
ncbi:MAG: phosphatidate cytidylyltransferase [Candidatus Izemoplasmatales bacterium]